MLAIYDVGLVVAVTSVQVPRIDPVSAEVFEREYVRTGTPVAFRGLVADWPVSQWDFTSWAERWPTRSVTVDEFPPARTGRFLPESVSMALPEFARRVAPESASPSHPSPVLCSNAKELPEVSHETAPPAMLGDRKLHWILFGGLDPIIHGHYHSRDNVLMCQVRGSKRGVLYAPTDTSRLYPHPVHSLRYNVARVNLQKPDTMRFPKFRSARPHEVFLEPGDALFIPVHWWHSTCGIGTSLSATLAWNARLREHRFPQPAIRNLLATALARSRGWGGPFGLLSSLGAP